MHSPLPNPLLIPPKPLSSLLHLQPPRSRAKSSMFAASDHQCPPVPIMEVDGRWRAHIQQAPNCPRCASTNTKFCYYNNYSLAQPRYFCKACRRYWTKGGSLRNVPEGGGCRKSRRSRSKASSSSLRDSPDDQGCPQGVNGSSSLSSSGPDIDLAAVFARYLNQDSGLPSQGLTTSAIEKDVQLVSQHADQGQYLFETLDHRHQVAADDQGFTADLESLDHGLLQTEDVFWSTSEDGSSLSSGFTAPWEPMAQQEELDSSPLELYASALDDQFSSNSTNSFLSDINWSCFDLTECGDFCRT